MLFRQLLVLLCLLPIPAMAADSPVYSHKAKGAVKGADVVAYYSLEPGEKALIGSDAFTYQWGGATWKFVNAENLAAFAANPEAYAPQYGGYCAFAVSHGFTKPVNPNKWKIVDGKLYLNLNSIAYRRWQADQDAAIIRADKNWPTVLTQCAQHNSCKY